MLYYHYEIVYKENFPVRKKILAGLLSVSMLFSSAAALPNGILPLSTDPHRLKDP